MTEPTPQQIEEHQKMPILTHVVELKNRVMVSLFFYLLAATICFFLADQILDFLLGPLRRAGLRHDFHLIFTSLPEVFLAHITLALAAGFIAAFPIIASQVWIFIAPGLYRHERHALLPYFIGAPLLFLCGASLCYWAAMPLAWKFFLSYQSSTVAEIPIVAQTRVADYVSLSLHFIIIFGLIFQTPLVFLLLGRLGVVSHEFLGKNRRYAVLLALIIAAFVTPTPDIFGQLLIAGPLYLLYEISILLIRWQGKNARPEIHPPTT